MLANFDFLSGCPRRRAAGLESSHWPSPPWRTPLPSAWRACWPSPCTTGSARDLWGSSSFAGHPPTQLALSDSFGAVGYPPTQLALSDTCGAVGHPPTQLILSDTCAAVGHPSTQLALSDTCGAGALWLHTVKQTLSCCTPCHVWLDMGTREILAIPLHKWPCKQPGHLIVLYWIQN